MYPAIKGNAITESNIRVMYGDDLIDRLLMVDAQPTSRVIDDRDDVEEWSASIEADNGDVVTVLYIIDTSYRDNDDEDDDPSNYDWTDYTFEID